MAGFNEWFMNGLQTAGTAVMDFLGLGTNQRAQQHAAGLQEDAQAHQSKENLINREWQEQMRNTAVSSQIKQLEDAGINTAMYFSGNGASGAATPSSPTGSASTASTASSPSNLGAVLNGAANMVQAFNRDGDSANNINLKQALMMISNVASIFK